MTRKKVKWARHDEPREAAKFGFTAFANDQIYDIVGEANLFADRHAEIERWIRQSGRNTHGIVNQIRNGAWVHPKRNDPEDAATIAFVVEQLLILNWDAYITAANIYPFLHRNFPQMSWDPNVIGRILGGVFTTFDMYDIMTRSHSAPPHIIRVRTNGAAQYAFDMNVPTWNWLRAIRRLTGNVMQQQLDYLRKTPAEQREIDDPGNAIWDRISTEIGYGGVDIRGDFTPDE